ncbi:hypothetical protein MUN82_03180 [Hymenobacter aerilatus]|uniref:Uncharacterized protein n=1 Tax=Hymenobacter aerilatus TaxID=2932251 RepID=A0A8T9SWJ1_9BACT|nr:hypothetical protein [Hymenobacter aerilatus]UOR06107.1 hypothetical protein MUN82_03180 [Hymenobacter aerilatus]
MEVSTLENHFLYWIDRFDHILSAEEFGDSRLYSFVQINNTLKNENIINEYLREEQKIINFIFCLVDQQDSELSNSRIRYSWQSSCSKKVNYLFTEEQIKFLAKVNRKYEQEIILNSKDELYNYLVLGVRELLKVKIKLADAYLEIGFDMSLVAQNVEEEKLLKLTREAGLHVLRKWEHLMWE